MADFTLRTGLSDPPPQPMRLRRAAAGFMAFYLAALLLNAEALEHDLDLIKYGWRRNVSVAMIRPVAAVSRGLGLGKPRQWLEQTIGAWIQHEQTGA
jgi:hypothetical protein